MAMPAARITVWLLGLCGAIGLVVAGELAFLGEVPELPQGEAKPLVLPPDPPAVQTALRYRNVDLYYDITRRPLFLHDRRPPKPADEKPAATEALKLSPLKVTLVGVVITSKSKAALFSGARKHRVEHVPQGGTIDSWQLDEVRPDGVSLSRGSERQDVPLRHYEPVPPAAVAPKAPRPGGSRPKARPNRAALRRPPAVPARRPRPPQR